LARSERPPQPRLQPRLGKPDERRMDGVRTGPPAAHHLRAAACRSLAAAGAFERDDPVVGGAQLWERDLSPLCGLEERRVGALADQIVASRRAGDVDEVDSGLDGPHYGLKRRDEGGYSGCAEVVRED